MKFTLRADARKATEMSLGVSCDKMMQTPLDKYVNDDADSSDNRHRQVKSRGSIYLQLGRMASVEKYRDIISKF